RSPCPTKLLLIRLRSAWASMSAAGAPACDVAISTVFFRRNGDLRALHAFPTLRSSDLLRLLFRVLHESRRCCLHRGRCRQQRLRSEEHTSELQSRSDLVCRLLLEKKKR